MLDVKCEEMLTEMKKRNSDEIMRNSLFNLDSCLRRNGVGGLEGGLISFNYFLYIAE